MGRFGSVAAVMALAITPFVGSAALAATCASAPSTTYTTAGFTCDFNGLTFSNMTITTIPGQPPVNSPPNAGVTLGNITPVILPGGEFGLTLNYSAFAPAGTFTDLLWQYTVAGNLIHDAFLSLTGGTTGTGSFTLAEQLTNGINLFCTGTTGGCQDGPKTFTPIAALGVLKDQFTLGGGTAGTFTQVSGITNAFSLVPLPGALGLFVTGLGMMGLLGWRRKRQASA